MSQLGTLCQSWDYYFESCNTWISDGLQYNQYCYANTNEPENIFEEVVNGKFDMTDKTDKVLVHNAKVTHVVLATKLYQKVYNADSTAYSMVTPELVYYRGVLYLGEAYKAMILSKLQDKKKLEYYTRKTTTGTGAGGTFVDDDYTQIDGSYLKMVDDAASTKVGEIKYVFDEAKNDVEFYAKDATTGEWKTTDIAQFKTDLATEQATAVTGTNNGDVMYYIPIEHLAAKATETNAVEAYYGVVRNHWYKLTINSFQRVGHLVFEPQTDKTHEIIPDTPEDPLYYVGAKINILSWKLVNQTVSDL